MEMNKTSFLVKYNICEEKYNKTGLEWSDLEAICKDYKNYRDSLFEPAELILKTLMNTDGVHSVRYRVKDPEHLIEKIIRKRIEKGVESNITVENYKNEIKDLIGLRALHLYKNEWVKINEHIKASWELNEEPVANYREGDPKDYIEAFKGKDLQVNIHKQGYRSIHYIVETKPYKISILAEIQVRTIFEEAWSEIDHTVRYPYDKDNNIYSKYLSILNRLAGSADEMGSFVLELKSHLLEIQEEKQSLAERHDQTLNELEKKVEESEDLEQKVEAQQAMIEELKEQNKKVDNLFTIGSSGLDVSDFYKFGSDLSNALSNLPMSNMSNFLIGRELPNNVNSTHENKSRDDDKE